MNFTYNYNTFRNYKIHLDTRKSVFQNKIEFISLMIIRCACPLSIIVNLRIISLLKLQEFEHEI